MKRSAHIFLLFPVIAVRLVTAMVPAQREGGNGSQRDSLVSGAEEYVESRDSRRSEDLGVCIGGSVEQRTSVKQTGVEEVWRDSEYISRIVAVLRVRTTCRPDFKVNSPKRSTPLAMAFSIKATLDGSREDMVMQIQPGVRTMLVVKAEGRYETDERLKYFGWFDHRASTPKAVTA